MTKLPVLALALGLLVVPALASSPLADFEETLKATKFTYEKDEDGDFSVTLNWTDEKRSQLVTIRGEAEDVTSGDFKSEVREVWSLCYSGDEPTKDQMKKMMLEHYKIGAFQIEEQKDDKFTAYFRIDIPAASDAAMLRNAIRICAEAADNMEKELTDKDDF